ncbi:MAG: heavy metal translocating P-type ATPase metal-binding domain-containing protein [Nitrospirae bacterium]|nr:heavy metal translocating P-type ATPase metal-binding domain-containing protein [Nitrospirota bacterium]
MRRSFALSFGSEGRDDVEDDGRRVSFTKIRCAHCLLEFNERDAVIDNFGGADKKFCCAGCRGIYRLVNDAGLDDFYTRRDGWSAGPSDTANTPNADVFTGSVRVSSDGSRAIGINIGGIRCASCVWLIERMMGKLPGVIDARINYATHSANIRWNASITNLGEILQRIASIGYRPLPADAGRAERELERESRDLLIRFGTAAFFSMQVMMYAAGLYAGYFDGIDLRMSAMLKWLALVLSAPVVTYCAMPFHLSAFRSLAYGAFGMDALISAGTIITFLFSLFELLHGRDVYFDSATMIVTFVLLGRYIENRARGRASGAISRLARLAPDTARRLDAGNGDFAERARQTVSAAELRLGDMVEALPGEFIARDGVSELGACEIDESMLTGEAAPVAKRAGAMVIGGTVVVSGAVIFRVTKNRDETILAGITRAVENAMSSKAPVERMADRISSIFVPAVFVLSGLALAAALWRGADLSRAVLTAVSVLVAACPCALGLATPLAVVTAIGRAASRGIIVAGGDILERLRGVKTVMFDKTGTLTTGRMRLVNTVPAGGISPDDALEIAASLEYGSVHPVAQAITGAAMGKNIVAAAENASYSPGLGASGDRSGYRYFAGNETFMCMNNIAMPDGLRPDSPDGQAMNGSVTHVFLGRADTGVIARFDLADSIRADAAQASRTLHGLDTIIVTGDIEASAARVARECGIPEYRAGLLPEQKLDIVNEFRLKGGVMMVGDGVNDAPARAAADIGVAMAQGSASVFESADIVIVSGRISAVPEIIAIGRRAWRIIRQNLFWAFAYNAVIIPLAMAGLLHPILSACAMALSSASVAANSMRVSRAAMATASVRNISSSLNGR